MLEIKHIGIEMNNIFYGFISRLNTVRKASDLDDISIETTKTERQRELKKKKNIRFSECVNFKRCNICVMEIPLRRRKSERKRNIWGKKRVRFSPN